MQTNKLNDDFQGVIIPQHILLSDTTASEMLVLSMIDGFTRSKQGMYWGTRRYLANALGISEKSTLRAIKSLISKGYLIEVSDCDGLPGLATADRSRFGKKEKREY